MGFRMSSTNTSSSVWIRIVGINTDKTRKLDDSGTCHQVYFILSIAPPREWRNIFVQEWQTLNPVGHDIRHEAHIDRDSLIVHCPLGEVPARLLVLKHAVKTSNQKHEEYLQEQYGELTELIGSLHYN
jgi:hypothetical protein